FQDGGIDSCPIVADLDVYLSALVVGAKEDTSGRWLSSAGADFSCLYAVVAAVAYKVSERVLDGLDDRFIKLGIGSVHLKPNLLAEGVRKVAHNARQLVPDHADRLHPGLHDAFLQFRGDQVQALRCRQQSTVLVLELVLQYLIPGEDQLPNQVHQFIE